MTTTKDSTNSKNQENVEELPGLENLHILLIRENMAHSPETWLYIHQLLAKRATQGLLPNTAEEFARLLSPLVCKNPQHQHRIVALMAEWLNQQQPTVQAKISSPEQVTVHTWQQRLQQFNRRSLYAVVILILLVTGLGLGFYFWTPSPDITTRQPVIENKSPTPTEAVTETSSQVQINDWIAPNPLPMPEKLPANWLFRQQFLGKAVPIFPVVLALLWLVWHYQKRMVLRNKAPQGEKLLTNLNFNLSQDNIVAPFTGADFAKAATKLLYPVWIDSRRLHIANSVNATVKNFGYFTPRYRQRHIHPEYLILVQSVHGNDQFADYAELLVKALQQQKVDVRSYRFRDDPRRLIPKIQPVHGADKHPLSLTQLAQKYTDARLIVISDWNILFQPYYPDRRQAWVKEFDSWLKRVWLSPGYDNRQWAERAALQAKELNFKLLPLASDSIEEIVQWLRLEGEQPAPLGKTGTKDDYLPGILSASEDSWLDWRPPHDMDLKRLCQELEKWLEKDGFLLLQALAAFPKPLSPLPHILDIQLFSTITNAKTDNQLRTERENRLQRISRLPWLRFAYMPDYLREYLIKNTKRTELKKISQAWTAILNALTEAENLNSINLPISLPKQAKLKIKNLLKSQTQHSGLNDPIFVNILLGGHLGLLDFSLPRLLNNIFPSTDKWLDVRPALLVMLLTGLSIWGVDKLWQDHGQQWLLNHWQDQIEQQNADWQVNIAYQTDTENLAKTLANSLQGKKFTVTQQQAQQTKITANNQIIYATGGETQAAQAGQALAWLTYNATVAQQEDVNLPKNSIQIQLQQTYQHTSSFTDELRLPYQAQKNVSKNDTKQTVVVIEPEMVEIPAGTFLMGSPANEKDSSDSERPQHKVTLKAFAIGKYEVTFDEYDAYAKANNFELPKDEGWGRGKRPVINVSFNDAQAYVDWLSKQTGKAYRLPTEAEWEYAARAGTTTPFHTGLCINTNQANYDGNYDYNNCGAKTGVYKQQTVAVGSYPANPWGLYDMAGNVWEWNQDCWHENYQAAPSDGSAWLKDQNGDCNRRVVRGGSWGSDPQNLRSALRVGYGSDEAINNQGFRIARAL